VNGFGEFEQIGVAVLFWFGGWLLLHQIEHRPAVVIDGHFDVGERLVSGVFRGNHRVVVFAGHGINGFRLLNKVSAQMPFGVAVVFVFVQHANDVTIQFRRPFQQPRRHFGRFLFIVDAFGHQINDAVQDQNSDVLNGRDGDLRQHQPFFVRIGRTQLKIANQRRVVV